MVFMKIKIFFTIINFIFAIVLISGAFWASDVVYFQKTYIEMAMKYPWYELTLSAQHNGGLLAAVFSGLQVNVVETGSKGEASSVPVLVYHGVTSRAGEGIKEEDFQKHMAALKRAGWETISLEEFEQFMKGEAQVPERSFLLTFDDGRKDSYYPVDPILRALDYTAVIFAITDQSFGEKGRQSHFYLEEKEFQHMERSGRWDVQSHGRLAHVLYDIGDNKKGHFLSNRLWLKDQRRYETQEEFEKRVYVDMLVSRQDIEQSLKKKAFAFAFPFGDFGQNPGDSNFLLAQDIVKNVVGSVYSFAFYQWWEGEGFTQNYADEGKMMIKRIEVENDWGADKLVDILEAGRAKSLPYSDRMNGDKSWLSTWGSYRYDISNGLVLLANDGEAGASVILDGSGAWKDYEVTARVESPTQTGVLLWVRFQDASNNAACNFGKDFVHIEQILDGEKRVIQGIRDVSPIPSGEFTIGARIQGRNVQCLVDGTVLIETPFLDKGLSRGGIGFKMWDQQIGKSALYIKQVQAYSF